MEKSPNFERQLRQSRRSFSRVPEVLAFSFVTLLLSYYLLAPFLRQVEPASLSAPPPSPIEDLPLDCFILQDASKSVNRNFLDRIAQEIIDRLNQRAGDRISFAYFGADTAPNPIPPPTSNRSIIGAERQISVSDFGGATDFALLFDRLRETIRDDRLTQKVTSRPTHADVVVILTDGIPELRTSSSPSMSLRCPDSNHRELVTRDIIEAFRTLIKYPYATQEPIYVRLVIAGAPPECESAIKQQWEVSLGRVVAGPRIFQVVLGDNSRAFVGSLLRPPRIILSLSHRGSDRDEIDFIKGFDVQYTAQSFLAGGVVNIKSGSIFTEEEEYRLEAVNDLAQSSIDSDSKTIVSVPAPRSGYLFGEAVHGSIYFRAMSRDERRPSQYSRHNLRIIVASDEIVEIRPSNLVLEPSNFAKKRLEVRRRLRAFAYWPMSIGFTFLVGIVLWYATSNAVISSTRKTLLQGIEKLLVLPYLIWLEVFLTFLIPMAMTVFLLGGVAVPVLVASVPLLVLIFLDLRTHKESPTASLLYRVVEFLALPFLYLLISKLV